MSYAQDLAKDRDKYLRQRNLLAAVVRKALPKMSRGLAGQARKLLQEIDGGDPITMAVEKITGTD